MEFSKGAIIYEEGGVDGRLFSLREGRVKLVHYLPDGRERIVRLLGRGDLAGLEALSHGAYRHTAIAMEEVSACRIERASLAKLGNQYPRLSEAIMRHWERSLDVADWWIMRLSTGPLEARAARLIHHLKQTETRGDGLAERVRLPPREEMAAMLDVATESLCRILGEFQRRGVLRRIGGSLYEFDSLALARIAGDQVP